LPQNRAAGNEKLRDSKFGFCSKKICSTTNFWQWDNLNLFGGANVLASRERLPAWPNPARGNARPTKHSRRQEFI
jgi:hypothetical protein